MSLAHFPLRWGGGREVVDKNGEVEPFLTIPEELLVLRRSSVAGEKGTSQGITTLAIKKRIFSNNCALFPR